MASVVVMGAGVAGLGAALGLAEAGHGVTVLERDGSTDADTGVAAFESWDRPNVPQFRQPHTVLARARNILSERAPAVIDRLLADGIEEVNFLKMFTPPERQLPEDDQFTAFLTRRPAFELALRRTVEATDAIQLRDSTVVTGLMLDDRDGGVSVRGLRAGEEEIAADVVIDAGGRRSPVRRWLADVGVEMPERVQDCELTYHARHFALTSDSELVPAMLVMLGFDMVGLTSITFPGEHQTFCLSLIPPTWDDDLKVLRHNWAWDAAAAAIPALAPWVDPRNATPISDVATMTGHRNLIRELVVDSRPIATGVLPVGDALCTTNPANGWGVSMALTTAFAAVDAIDEVPDDPVGQVLRYNEAIRDELEEVFLESSALDRLRRYRWLGEEVPEQDQAEADRAELLRVLSMGADRDPELGRELLRRVNLLQSPRATLTDPDLRAKVIALKERHQPDLGVPAATRDDVVAAIAAAAP